jgi:hypothetical protein
MYTWYDTTLALFKSYNIKKLQTSLSDKAQIHRILHIPIHSAFER